MHKRHRMRSERVTSYKNVVVAGQKYYLKMYLDISSPWNYKVLSEIFVKIELFTFLFCNNLFTL